MLPTGKQNKPNCHPDRPIHSNGLCKSCYLKQWRKDNPEKAKEYQRRNTYGVSPEDFTHMMVEQNYCCGICLEPFGDERPVIEHDHETNFVRGLVHYWCNTRLTAVEDSAFLNNALRYLTDARKRYDDQERKICSSKSVGQDSGQTV